MNPRQDGTPLAWIDSYRQVLKQATERVSDRSTTPRSPRTRCKNAATLSPRTPFDSTCLRANDAVVLVLSMLCASIRNVRMPRTRLTALWLLVRFARFTTDEVRLERVLPYILKLLTESQQHDAVERACTIKALTELLQMVDGNDGSVFSGEKIYNQETLHRLFPEFILPAMSGFPMASEPIERLAFAECLPHLAETARRFLEVSHAAKMIQCARAPPPRPSNIRISRSRSSSAGSPLIQKYERVLSIPSVDEEHDSPPIFSFHAALCELQDSFKTLINPMVGRHMAYSSMIKQALLQNAVKLCIFFDGAKNSSYLLPWLFSFLNDSDWTLRASLFEHIGGVLCFSHFQQHSGSTLEGIMSQMLCDQEEIVVSRVLECILTLISLENPLFSNQSQLELAKGVAPLLVHPLELLRRRARAVIVGISKHFGVADTHVLLLPELSPFVQTENTFGQVEITDEVLEAAALEPLSRSAFNDALQKLLRPQTRPMYRWKEDNETPDESRTVSVAGVAHEAHGTTNVPDANPREEAEDSMQKFLLEKKLQWLRPFFRQVSQSIRTHSANKPRQTAEQENYSRALVKALDGHSLHVPAQSSLPASLPLVSTPASASLHEADSGHPFDSQPEALSPYTQLQRQQQQFQKWDEAQMWHLLHSEYGIRWDNKKKPRTTNADSGQIRVEDEHSHVPPTAAGPRKSVSCVIPPDQSVRDAAALRRLLQSLAVPPLPPELGRLWRRKSNIGGDDASGGADANGSGYNLAGKDTNASGFRDDELFSPNLSKWRPSGALIHHLTEHSQAVSQLVVAQDESFFASGSDDGSVKIWPTNGMIDQVLLSSQATFIPPCRGRITSLCTCQNSRALVVGTSKGNLYIVRVETQQILERKRAAAQVTFPFSNGAAKGSKNDRWLTSQVAFLSGRDRMQSFCVGDYSDDAVLCAEHCNTESQSLILYAGQHSGVNSWDLRCRRAPWRLPTPPEIGCVSCIARPPINSNSASCATATAWVSAATNRGFLALWDLRYSLMAKLWRHPSRLPVHDLVVAPHLDPTSQSSSRGSGGHCPVVLAACGENEVAAWNLENGRSRGSWRVEKNRVGERMRSRSRRVGSEDGGSSLQKRLLPITPPTPPESNIIVSGDAMTDLMTKRPPGIRSILCPPFANANGGASASYLISGGDDRQIRYWSLKPDKVSYTIAGLKCGQRLPSYSSWSKSGICICNEYDFSNKGSAPEETRGLRSPPIYHMDSVLSVAVVQQPIQFLLSGSRDGVIKIWR